MLRGVVFRTSTGWQCCYATDRVRGCTRYLEFVEESLVGYPYEDENHESTSPAEGGCQVVFFRRSLELHFVSSVETEGLPSKRQQPTNSSRHKASFVNLMKFGLGCKQVVSELHAS